MKSASSHVSASVSGALGINWCFPKYLSLACCTAGVRTHFHEFCSHSVYFSRNDFLPVSDEAVLSHPTNFFSPLKRCSKRDGSQPRFSAAWISNANRPVS